ncbi:hypothetical protein MBLNU230_g6686t1 [Neophaeotheca triangularis]
MPWKSRWTIDIPTASLPTYLFGPPSTPSSELETKPILIDSDEPSYNLTQRSYRQWSKRLAAGLKNAGFQPGDRLLLYSGNTIFFPTVLMGTIMAGGIFTGVNPGNVAKELAYQLSDSGAKFMLSSSAGHDIALDAAKSINFPTSHVFVFDNGYATFDNAGAPEKSIQHWSKLHASSSSADSFQWKDFTTQDAMSRTAVLNYSSGTTGVPKGVEISHLNYIANCHQTSFMTDLDANVESKLKRAVGLSMLPMYHAYGQTIHCVSCPRRQIPVYVMQKFDFVKMLAAIQRYRVTDLTLVPPIVVALAKRPEVKDYDLSSVEAAGSGAAPLGREPTLEFEALWPEGRVNMKQGWGMSEVTCSACGFDPNDWSYSSAVGELNPNLEAQIVDPDGREVGEGERGEFWIRGPNVMKGYWRKPEATADTKTRDGWLKTGDVALTEWVEGRDGGRRRIIHIVDRIKELIKVKGNQVAPAELEALLLENAAVADAAVVGVTINGEEYPRAYIVLQAGQKALDKEIADWLAERVARHKRLQGGVAFVDEIPKNPSGKILRKILRERAKGEVGDREPGGSKL